MKKTIEIEIPNGYELDLDEQNALDVYNGRPVMFLWLKQKKDWDWYITGYRKQLSSDFFLKGTIFENIQHNRWINVPFEIKIGLLKFICVDCNYSFLNVLKHIINSNVQIEEYRKILINMSFIESIKDEFVIRTNYD